MTTMTPAQMADELERAPSMMMCWPCTVKMATGDGPVHHRHVHESVNIIPADLAASLVALLRGGVVLPEGAVVISREDALVLWRTLWHPRDSQPVTDDELEKAIESLGAALGSEAKS